MISKSAYRSGSSMIFGRRGVFNSLVNIFGNISNNATDAATDTVTTTIIKDGNGHRYLLLDSGAKMPLWFAIVLFLILVPIIIAFFVILIVVSESLTNRK